MPNISKMSRTETCWLFNCDSDQLCFGTFSTLSILFGLIFFIPLLGMAAGAAMGALGGSLADVGIDGTEGLIAAAWRDRGIPAELVNPAVAACLLGPGDVAVGRLDDPDYPTYTAQDAADASEDRR